MTELDISQISNLITQRYPFMMVDKVLEIEPWDKLKAIKNLSFDEPYFRGHFPGKPIMPGVLMIEAIAQATVILYKFKNKITMLKNYELVLGSVKARFSNSGYPGDQMIIEVAQVKFISTGGVAKGISRVGERLLCQCEISFSAQEQI